MGMMVDRSRLAFDPDERAYSLDVLVEELSQEFQDRFSNNVDEFHIIRKAMIKRMSMTKEFNQCLIDIMNGDEDTVRSSVVVLRDVLRTTFINFCDDYARTLIKLQ